MESKSVSETRAELPSLLRRVEAGERIAITRHDKPVAVLVRPDLAYDPRAIGLILEAQELGRSFEEARRSPLGPEPDAGVTVDYADDLIAWIREGRDGR